MHETREDIKLRVERLKEIREEMLELLSEARKLIEGTNEEACAEGYWLSSIEIELSKTHSYVDRSMCSMEDTIEALEEEGEEETKR